MTLIAAAIALAVVWMIIAIIGETIGWIKENL